MNKWASLFVQPKPNAWLILLAGSLRRRSLQLPGRSNKQLLESRNGENFKDSVREWRNWQTRKT
jgi:hypothetical protein